MKLLYSIAMGYSRKLYPRYNFLRKPPRIFKFVTLPLEILGKTRFHPYPWKFCRIVCHLLQIPRSKAKDPWMEIPHQFFLRTPRNSTSFLIHPWNFHMLFLQYSLKFHVLDPPSLASYVFIHGREK